MRLLFVVTMGSIALLASACGADVRAPGQSGSTAAESAAGVAVFMIPACETVERISAPAESYRDSPIYVANEQPTQEIRAWAAGQPGFEEIWVDREHLGWITLAFSVDAESRQAELEELFPDVGVVAVGVDWTMAELMELQRRVGAELGPLFGPSSGISVTQGVVTIGAGVLTGERVAAIEERFAGERVCIEGIDPQAAPAGGPQAPAGDGWRLLADEPGLGQAYRTGIATNEASYERLWTAIGLPDQPAPVDFEAEVVIWFGAVYGSGCPNLRLDDVVVDRERALVHAEIVLVDAPQACTGDANPRAYLVALKRDELPSGPFGIQLGADDPTAGVFEERTLVDVDLSQPGAVAGIGEVHGDPALPEPFVLEPGSIIEPDIEYPYRLFVHCGIEWLGTFNDVAWRADLPAGSLGAVPPQWPPAGADQTRLVSIILHTDPEPVIEATANGHTVTYRPSADEPPGCD